jgi:hypothetical protein
MQALAPSLLLSLLLTGGLACSESTPAAPSCEGEKCDAFDLPESEIEASPCDGSIVDKSGRGLSGKIAGRLNDPLAKLVLRAGDSCPTSFEDIMEKLNSAAAQDGFSCDERRSMLVSETAQALGEATSYRSVTALDCEQPEGTAGLVPPGFGSSNRTGVLFSLFGLSPDGDLPENVEIIAFDKSSGVFNYYESDGDKINFFGNSKDMLEGTGSAGDRRCAACHTGGGLIMKELQAPWLHWEGDTDTPGASDFISKHEALLGNQSDGIDMEDIVISGNEAWSEIRVAHLKEAGNTQELLRPLFCTVEVNLESATSFDNGTKEGVADFFSLSPTIFNSNLGFGSIDASSEEYDAIIRANGQQLRGLPAENIETVFGLTTVTKAAADQAYIEALEEAGIVNRQLVEDIAAVDFTRVVFSDDRCGLLENVPNIPADDLNPAKITEAILAQLGQPAEGTPEAELKNNLASSDNNVSASVTAFTDACSARTEKQSVTFTKDGSSQTMDVPSALVDYMQIVSLNRALATQLSVFEFPQTMPSDDQNVPAGTRLDPTTCQLTRDFVGVSAAAEEVACCRTCGDNSQACGDSCISLDLTCNQPVGCACEG